uniref:Helix-turn-helix domain-containing protein n=1 Tax=Candidatus Kentrum sp. DK TaxID=2126562 RepID=A0A450SBM6_9GAMM|nr:MAG: Helix-turn-helix domain-containing protein [Candidatus Kentron sp. DK]
MSLGARLKEERTLLRLSQTDFGGLCGVTRQTQRLYEKGDRAPDSNYLATIAKAGADVLYIITGQHGPSGAGEMLPNTEHRQKNGGEERLKPDESALLENYRHLSRRNQEIIREMSAALAQRESGDTVV